MSHWQGTDNLARGGIRLRFDTTSGCNFCKTKANQVTALIDPWGAGGGTDINNGAADMEAKLEQLSNIDNVAVSAVAGGTDNTEKFFSTTII